MRTYTTRTRARRLLAVCSTLAAVLLWSVAGASVASAASPRARATDYFGSCFDTANFYATMNQHQSRYPLACTTPEFANPWGAWNRSQTQTAPVTFTDTSRYVVDISSRYDSSPEWVLQHNGSGPSHEPAPGTAVVHVLVPPGGVRLAPGQTRTILVRATVYGPYQPTAPSGGIPVPTISLNFSLAIYGAGWRGAGSVSGYAAYPVVTGSNPGYALTASAAQTSVPIGSPSPVEVRNTSKVPEHITLCVEDLPAQPKPVAAGVRGPGQSLTHPVRTTFPVRRSYIAYAGPLFGCYGVASEPVTITWVPGSHPKFSLSATAPHTLHAGTGTTIKLENNSQETEHITLCFQGRPVYHATEDPGATVPIYVWSTYPTQRVYTAWASDWYGCGQSYWVAASEYVPIDWVSG